MGFLDTKTEGKSEPALTDRVLKRYPRVRTISMPI